MKAMENEGSRFAFLQKFLQISMEKLKAGIFDGPRIREFMKDPMFDKALRETELSAWQSLEVISYKLQGKPPECGIREGNWRATEEFSPTGVTNVSQTAFVVKLGLFSQEVSRVERRAGWALSPRHLHYGRVLPRPMGCKLSCWLLLVLEMVCSGCWAQEKVPEKIFPPRIDSFV